MAKIVFDERYGNVSYAQRAAYRKYNVSPSDHDSLENAYGDDHDAITAAVKRHSDSGMFDLFSFEMEGR